MKKTAFFSVMLLLSICALLIVSCENRIEEPKENFNLSQKVIPENFSDYFMDINGNGEFVEISTLDWEQSEDISAELTYRSSPAKAMFKGHATVGVPPNVTSATISAKIMDGTPSGHVIFEGTNSTLHGNINCLEINGNEVRWSAVVTTPGFPPGFVIAGAALDDGEGVASCDKIFGVWFDDCIGGPPSIPWGWLNCIPNGQIQIKTW